MNSLHSPRNEQSKTEFRTKNSEKKFGESETFSRSRLDPATGVRICSKEDLAEEAQKIEVKIPVKKSQAQYNFDPTSVFVHYCWGRRPDWAAINEALQVVYILKFKQSTDRD